MWKIYLFSFKSVKTKLQFLQLLCLWFQSWRMNEYSHWKIQNVCVSLCRSTHMQSWANTQETKLIWFSVTWLLLQRCWESTLCPQGDKTGQIALISSSRSFVILVCSLKSDFSTQVLWGEWRGRRQQTEEWVRGGGGCKGRQYAGSEWTTGRREGEYCQNQHAFGETCFCCWIQGLPLIPTLSGCYCTFTVFTVDSVRLDFKDTNHPVWEQSQLNDSQNCKKLDSCSYWLETILSKLPEFVRQDKSSFGLESIFKE